MSHTTEAAVAPRFALRLRFPADVEAGFVEYHFHQSLLYMRLAIVLEIVLYAAFGILDTFIVPEQARWVWLIRYAIVCPLSIAVLWLTFTARFESVAQPVLAGLAAVAGLGIVAMVAVVDVGASSLYYAGLLLVIPWAYTALRLRFAYATAAAAAILVAYEVVAIWVNPTSLHILVNNNFFFVSSVIISMVAGYMLERSLRTEFKQRRLIEEQRAALADHNAELGSALQDTLEEVRRNADELAASRARIVAAADAERRRIERNLHDGAQQRLVALALHLGLAARTSVDDGQAAAADLLQLRDEVQEALDELRTLAHGIYPPLLMDKGLEAALRAAAKRASQPATVRAESLRRYPAETEAAVYFCCLEALQNAAKHAGPDATILITVREEPGALRFEVTDDGAGFDAKTKSAGSGFTNMSDRLGAVGGTVSVDAAPGRGTRVGGWLPLDGEPNGGLGADRAAPEVRAPSSAV